MAEQGYLKIVITVPWMIGVALILGISDVYLISICPPDSLWRIWSLLALVAFSVGAGTGWLWGRWGLLLLLVVPPIFVYLGHLRVKPFYSNDVGWGLPVFLYLVPTLPFLLLGVALSSFLKTRYEANGTGIHASK